ncbi:MAG: C4-type zinc ribbon domain-containing protein [Acidimicrobiales bacterium]
MEDDELELMEQLEEIEARVDSANAECETTRQAITAKQTELEIALEEVDAQVVTNEAARAEAATVVPTELLVRYEQLRGDMGGVAVARLVSNSCSGCHLSLSAVEADKMKHLPDDAVVTCDSCGRILIR